MWRNLRVDTLALSYNTITVYDMQYTVFCVCETRLFPFEHLFYKITGFRFFLKYMIYLKENTHIHIELHYNLQYILILDLYQDILWRKRLST